MKLSVRQQALLVVLSYAALMLIAFALFKTLLYVFVFSLVSILIVNFILKNLLRLKFPYPLAVTISLLFYFFVLTYAFINIIPPVFKQVSSFYDFMKKILDSKYWENYLVDNPDLSETIGNIVAWASPKISELFSSLAITMAKSVPNTLTVMFYSILFT
ncbi:MAG: AI-2E family transporter, partial [Fervidobacterium sp.]